MEKKEGWYAKKKAFSARLLQVNHQTALPSLAFKNSPNSYRPVVARRGQDIFVALARTPNNRIHIIHAMC